MIAQRWCRQCRDYRPVEHTHDNAPSLFDTEPEDRQTTAITHAARARRDHTIQARFVTFHTENPRVYQLLVRFARQMKATGREQCGIRLVWERMRWEVAITTRDPDGFKLNDHYHSRYARLIMDNEPDLAGFFHTRKLKAS